MAINIEKVKEAIEKADRMESDLPIEQFEVPALASLKIRHLLNNLGALSTRYLECGPHLGGSFTATIAGNDNISFATAVDSFASDHMNGDKVHPKFLINAKAFLPENTLFNLIVSDCFETDLSQIPPGIDLYLYDAGHEYEDQRDALVYFKPVLAGTFIFCCDDWSYRRVKEGTMDGISEGGYEILFQQELENDDKSEENHSNDNWWRGYGVFVLKKK